MNTFGTRLVGATLAIFFAAVSASYADAVFTPQTAGTYNWTDTGNWVDGNAPDATELERVVLPNRRPASGGEARTVLLDRSNQILQGGLGLSVYSPGISSYGEAGLTFDLNSNTLVVDGGEVAAMQQYNTITQVVDPTVTVTNGTFQLGTASNATSLVVGNGWMKGLSTRFSFSNSSTFNATNLNSIAVAGEDDTRFAADDVIFDLSDTTVNSGAASNTLNVVTDVRIGLSTMAYLYNYTRNASLLLPSALATFSIGNDLILGQTTGSGTLNHSVGTLDFGGGAELDMSVGHSLLLGHGGDGIGSFTNLPTTLNIEVGSATTRGGDIALGYKDRITSTSSENQQTQGSLTTTGGTFDAYVENVYVGRNSTDGSLLEVGAGTPGATGTLDLSASTLGTLDVSGGIFVGVGENATGVLRLNGGAIGTITADTVDVGTDGGTGELSLTGTTLNVGSSMTLGINGDLSTDGSLDLGAITLAIEIDSSGNTGLLDVATGDLDIGETTLSLSRFDGGYLSKEHAYIIATYDSLTGGSFAAITGGYELIDYNYLGGNQIAVFIPEPSSLALVGLAATGLLLNRRRKRR